MGAPARLGQVRGGLSGAERRERLAAARLYLVCAAGGREGLAGLLGEAVAGGVQVVQLREKELPDAELRPLAEAGQALCERMGALFVLNDNPRVAAGVGADGVHVGQEDMPVAQVRELVGPEMLIGLSTHSPEQIEAVDAGLVDYIGVGPIHETPTKPGRPAVGLELIRYAAARAPVPFFAIGGLDAGNTGEALEAGAQRIVVLRAIADAPDPRAAAGELRALLDDRPGEPR